MNCQKIQSNQAPLALLHRGHRGVCDVYIHHVRNTYMERCSKNPSPPYDPYEGPIYPLPSTQGEAR